MEDGVVGLEGEGAFETGDRLVEVSAGALEFGEVAVKVGDVGLDGDGAGDQLDGALGLAGLAEDDAEQVEGEGVVWLLNEDLAVDLAGFGDCAGAVEFDGGIELLGDGVEGRLGLRFQQVREYNG